MSSYSELLNQIQLNQTGTGNQSAPIIIALDGGGFFATWFDAAYSDPAGQVRGAVYDANGNLVGSEFTIGTTVVEGSAGSEMPALDATLLANGSIVVGWVGEQSIAADGSLTSTLGAIVDPTTQTAGTQFVMNTTTFSNQSAPVIEALPGGGFFAAWYGPNAYEDVGSGGNVFGQYFDANGNPVGSEMQLGASRAEPSNNGDMPNIDVTVLTTGEVVVGWVSENADDAAGPLGDGTESVGVVINGPGNASTEIVFNIAGETQGNQSAPVIEALPGGNFIAVWYDEAYSDPASGIQAQIFDSTGAPISPVMDIGTYRVEGSNTGSMPPINVEVLNNGEVVIGWVVDNSDASDGSGTSVSAVVINTADPTAPTTSNEIHINTGETLGNQSAPVIVATNDGGFFMTWYDEAYSPAAGVVFGRYFDADGNPTSAEFQIGTVRVEGASTGKNPALTAELLANGDVAVSWVGEADDAALTDGSGTAVMGAIIPTAEIVATDGVVEGTDGADTIDDAYNGDLEGDMVDSDGGINTLSDDATIDAGGGNDSVIAGAGGDAVFGGDGNDTIWGGTGDQVSDQIQINSTESGDQSPPVITATNDGGYFAAWYDDGYSTGTQQVRGQYFDANGNPIGEEIDIGTAQVEDSQSGDVPYLDVITLANGDVVVGWMSDDGQAVDGSFSAAVGVIIDSSTQTAGSQFVINDMAGDGADTASSQTAPLLVALSNGGWFAVWNDQALSTTTAGSVHGQYFNADGTANGPVLDIGTSTVDNNNALDVPALTAIELENGEVLVGWQATLGANADGDGRAPVGVIIDGPSQAQVGTQFVFNSEAGAITAGSQSAPIMEALPGGGFIGVWYDNAQGNPLGQVQAQIYDASGAPVGGAIDLGTSVPEDAESFDNPLVSITTLADGNVVVGWATNDALAVDGSQTAVVGVIVDPTTQTATAQFVMNTTTAGYQSAPVVVATQDGGFFATWYDNAAGNPAGEVHGQYFDADGNPIGAELTLGTAIVEGNDAANVPVLDAVVLASGDVVVSWAAENGTVASGIDPVSVIVQSPLTDGADSIEGGAGDDVVFGEAGDDFIAGDDNAPAFTSFPGGTFDYTMNGGWISANLEESVEIPAGLGVGDTFWVAVDHGLIKGAQLQVVADSDGNLVLQQIDAAYFNPSSNPTFAWENIQGDFDAIQAAFDPTTGAALNFSPPAGSSGYGVLNVSFADLSDEITTGYITTAASGTAVDYQPGGDDSLYGGAGNDTILGEIGEDSIDGGEGDDSIDGGADNDTITGGADGDTIFGGAGNDVIDETTQAEAVNVNSWTLGGPPGNLGAQVSGNLIAFNGGDRPAGDFIEQDFATTAGQEYTFGFTAFENYGTNTSNTLEVEILDSQGNVIDTQTVVVPNNATVPFEVTFAAVDENTSIRVTNTVVTNTFSSDVRLQDFTFTALTDGADQIDGGEGDDTIIAAEGNDTVAGGSGFDSIDGGDGNDTIDGGSGFDTIFGGDGDDFIDGELGQDSIDGGAGNDTIIGGEGGVASAPITLNNPDAEGGTEFSDGQWTLGIPGWTASGAGYWDNNSTGPFDAVDPAGESFFIDGGGSMRQILPVTFDENGQIVINFDQGTRTNVGGGTLQVSLLVGGVNVGLAQTTTTPVAGSVSAQQLTFDLSNATNAAALNGQPITLVFTNTTGSSQVQLDNIEAQIIAPNSDTINGGAGDDSIVAGSGFDSIDGGEGADIIDGGADNDTITGGAENDSITGGLGDDSIGGGTGSEAFLVGIGDGNDTIIGGEDADGQDVDTIRLVGTGWTINYTNGDPTTESGTATNGSQTITFSEIEEIGFVDGIVHGTNTDDVIDGSYVEPTAAGEIADLVDNNDAVEGTLNNPSNWSNEDLIYGYGGNDSILSGADNDMVFGGEGNDTVDGGTGDDTIDGEDGADSLEGGDGNDSITGGTDEFTNDQDSLYGGAGSDTLETGFAGGLGSITGDLLYGGAGGDLLIETTNSLDTEDTFYGGAGADTIIAQTGNDSLVGGAGNDSLSGGAGNDVFLAGGGDTVEGGTGSDTINLNGTLAETGAIFIDGGEDGDDSDFDVININGLTDAVVNDNGDESGTITYTNTNGETVTVNYTNIEAVICYVDGNYIRGDRKDIAVEELEIGDLVATVDNGLQPIRWIGKRHVTAEELKANPKLTPIRIKEGALGNGLPEFDLILSPQHRMLVKSKIVKRMFGVDEVLIAAKKLLDLPGVELADDLDAFTYVHFLCDAHELVYAEGAISESLYLGGDAKNSLPIEALEEIFGLFPELVATKDQAPSRLIPEAQRQKLVIERHVRNGKTAVS